MRIYTNAKEALSEIQRDLAEMGIHNHSRSYQDKFIGDDPQFDTMELQNYMYMLIDPLKTMDDLNPTQPWADEEFMERFFLLDPAKEANPGTAWLSRKDVWEQFLGPDGKFAYTYGERLAINDQFMEVARALEIDNNSRQGFVSIWKPEDTSKLGGLSRVPCSLGYYFQIRKGELTMTYLQRSADFVTHFRNDVWLAIATQRLMANILELPVGSFTHWIGSLHVFQKDIEGTF